MTDRDAPIHAGNTLFETFVEQVKQVLEHLYDFAYLQQHPLARMYDGQGDLAAKTAGRQLRQDLISAIESMKPLEGTHFRESTARLYHILHLYYIENLTIQEVAIELGLSERQAYRDLRRGQESAAALLWDKHLPPAESPAPVLDSPAEDRGDDEIASFSFDSEIARLKPDFQPVDLAGLVQQASAAVDRLAQQRGIAIEIVPPPRPLMVSTDSGIAHQVIVSVLSHAVQQANTGRLIAVLGESRASGHLTLHFSADTSEIQTTTAIRKLAERIGWRVEFSHVSDGSAHVTVYTTSKKTTLLIIDDNEGWSELVKRFVEEYNCAVVSLTENGDHLPTIRDIHPAAILLDVMMPRRDGWETLQRLRAQSELAEVPIVVCSVFNDPQLALSLGASAFVAKPANRETIVETLQQLGVI